MLDLELGIFDGCRVAEIIKKAPTKTNILFRLLQLKLLYFNKYNIFTKYATLCYSFYYTSLMFVWLLDDWKTSTNSV